MGPSDTPSDDDSDGLEVGRSGALVELRRRRCRRCQSGTSLTLPCSLPPARTQAFSDDEDLARDTTAAALAGGRDIQGIPWELTQYTRAGYRVSRAGGSRSAPLSCQTSQSLGLRPLSQAVRNGQYHNYMNLEEAVAAAQPRIDADAVQQRRPCARLFDFYRRARAAGELYGRERTMAAPFSHNRPSVLHALQELAAGAQQHRALPAPQPAVGHLGCVGLHAQL